MSWKDWNIHSQRKIIPPDKLIDKLSLLRSKNLTIATLNGSFDLLHAGHLFMLYEAKRVADVLIVALNSDQSIQAYKSKDRPIIPLSYRIEMLTAIEFVDFVTWFDETDPRQILDIIKPDIHVNGEEYGPNCIESDVVRKNGGKLYLVPRIEGLSTSAIIKKIRGLHPCV